MNGILNCGKRGLIKLLAIRLGCLKTSAKSLVMSPFFFRFCYFPKPDEPEPNCRSGYARMVGVAHPTGGVFTLMLASLFI